jgi:LysM repeat protein
VRPILFILLARDTGYTASYRYTQLRGDGYKEGSITGTRTDNAGAPGVTTDSYDVNGTLIGIADSTSGENDRSFISDAAGIVLQKTQQGHVQRQIVVGGQVIGQLGTGLDALQPTDKDGNQRYVDYQNFNIGYRPVDSNYPTAEAGSYHVQAGDTLQGIAQNAYGDSQLWYLIADANGIQGNGDLRVGQALILPNRVGTIHNDAKTFKPYEPGKVLGDTTPNLPAPSGGDDCGGFGMILVVVVAVVVTVLTAGAATPALGAVMGGAVGAIRATC